MNRLPGNRSPARGASGAVGRHDRRAGAGGASVADVGCGHGASAVLIARAFPRSRITGFDYHEGSVAFARAAAARAGVSANTAFEAAGAAGFPGAGYDLVACFDALHDMGDPVGAARHTRAALAPDDTFMVVEPRSADRVEDNFNPVGRMFYAASTMICTPVALDQEADGPAGGGAARSRVLPRPRRDRDALQHGGRSETLTTGLPRALPARLLRLAGPHATCRRPRRRMSWRWGDLGLSHHGTGPKRRGDGGRG